jgi:hypothetical protein
VDHARDDIARAIKQQVDHGRFERDTLYGDGHAGKRIADLLAELPLQREKRLAY